MKRDYKGPELFALFIAGIFVVPYGWWANAYVLSHIWNWYLPPLMPAMTFKPALGLSFVVWLLMSGFFIGKKKSSEDHDAWTLIVLACVMPWVSLAGARIALWMFFQ